MIDNGKRHHQQQAQGDPDADKHRAELGNHPPAQRLCRDMMDQHQLRPGQFPVQVIVASVLHATGLVLEQFIHR
ncbi:hypothetical protein D3C81_1617890 [compost metagenome]